MNGPATSIVMDGPTEDLHSAESPFVTALNFLRKDNEYRAIFTQRHITEYTRVVESVNAAVLVATFIAGVQSQIIALTVDKNDTRIQVATNAIGFLGLVLDILGASQGVIHAVKLKKSISEAQAPGHLFMDNERLNRIQEILDNASKEKQQIQTSSVESLLKEMQECKKFWSPRRMLFIPRDPEFRKHLNLLFPTDGRRIGYWVLGAELDEALRRSTLSTIRLGVLFLLISVLCFAGYSQPPAVWITCVVVTLAFGASFISGVIISGVIGLSCEGPVVQNLEQASEIFDVMGTMEGVNPYSRMVVSILEIIIEGLLVG